MAIEFDFYAVGSWDGESLVVRLDYSGGISFVPAWYQPGGISSETGNLANDWGSYTITSRQNGAYRIRLDIAPGKVPSRIGFGNTLDQETDDESSIISNLVISQVGPAATEQSVGTKRILRQGMLPAETTGKSLLALL